MREHVKPIYIPKTKNSVVSEKETLNLSLVGERIKVIRQQKGMSQEELASFSGISRRTISSLEGGKGLSLQNLIKVLKALGISHRLNDLIMPLPVSPKQVVLSSKKQKS
jgi:transcriptional regulator with XRE-family HTH domain